MPQKTIPSASQLYSWDGLDETYRATLNIPWILNQHLNISIRHYNTCFEGLKLPHELSSRGVHQIDFGPLPWQKMAEAVQSELERDNQSHETLVISFGSDNLQVCSKSHDNEAILHGAWIEQQIKSIGDLSYVNMTIQAKWTPFKMCKLIQQGPTGIGKHFRMGDSTVPGRNIEIGVHLRHTTRTINNNKSSTSICYEQN